MKWSWDLLVGKGLSRGDACKEDRELGTFVTTAARKTQRWVRKVAANVRICRECPDNA